MLAIEISVWKGVVVSLGGRKRGIEGGLLIPHAATTRYRTNQLTKN